LPGQVVAPFAQHRRHACAADLVGDLVERLGREARRSLSVATRSRWIVVFIPAT
jgi:hypothetical protein